MGILNVYTFTLIATFPLFIIALMIKNNGYATHSKKKTILFVVCILIIIQLLLETTTYYLSLLDMSTWYFWTYLAHDVYFLLDVVIFYLLALISISDFRYKKVNFIISLIPLVFYIAILIINHFTPIMFYIDKNYHGFIEGTDLIAYQRHDYVWISFVIAGIYGCYFFFTQIARARKSSLFDMCVLTLIGLSMLGGMAGQIMFSIPLMWPCISTCIILYYLHYCNKTFEKDIFTNIANRNLFERKMIEFEKYKEVWVIVCDVNELKYINDTYGHRKGDEFLACVAKLLANSFSHYGVVCRIGGDEFCVLSPSKQKPEKLKMIFEKINEGIVKAIPEVRLDYPLSYGFSCYKKEITDRHLIDVFEEADLMMFKMKKSIK